MHHHEQVLGGHIHEFVLRHRHRMILNMDPSQTNYSNRHQLGLVNLQQERIFGLDTTEEID